MNISTQKIPAGRLFIIMAFLIASISFSGHVLADPAPLQQAENSATTTTTTTTTSPSDNCKSTTTTDTLKKCVQTNVITTDLQTIVNVLSAGVGIIVIAMIILGGIQYSIAGDNPQATGAAKKRIGNALLALFAYLFIFAFLQWIIPGGLFG